ncbi:MAG: MCE family protein [Muribaculaceae bacterium]|nr:MCE family protein [Muribaculaceae bacterium]
MKKIFTKEVIIGTCVVVALVILVVGIEFLKGINVFKPAHFYVAQYDNVADLEIAAPVTIDGYKVGQVRDIEFDYENLGKVKVYLALNKKLRIPVDSKAVIGSTLLSGSYVEIVLGESKEYLPIDGEIPSGTIPDLMSSISNDVLPSVSSIMPKVDSLLSTVNNLASDPALLASIQNLEVITRNMSAASGNLSLMMQRDLPTIIKNADVAVVNIDSLTNNLALLSSELNKLPLDQTMDNVNQLTRNLASFSESLNNPNSTLGELTRDSELYERLNRLTSDIDSLIIDIKNNPKRYISIKLL